MFTVNAIIALCIKNFSLKTPKMLEHEVDLAFGTPP